MIILQLVLFCLLFTLLVRCSVIGGAVNALYFYPRSYQEKAYRRGIAKAEDVQKKRKRFMGPFIVIMALALIFIVAIWNDTADFKSAYLQTLLFLEVMNWYDGIVIDRLWVGHSSFWIIHGMEGEPFVQSWKQVLKKRSILTLIFIALAVIGAELIVLISRVF